MQDLRSDFHLLEGINLGIDRAKRQRGRDALEGRIWSRAVPLQPTMNRDQPQQPDADVAVGFGALGSLATAGPPGSATGEQPPRAQTAGRSSAQNKLVKAAAVNGTLLLLMPSGMSRRAANTSCADKRASAVKWRVEFAFPAAAATAAASGAGALAVSLAESAAEAATEAAAEAAAEVTVERASQDATWRSLLAACLASSSPALQHTLRRQRRALEALEAPGEPLRLLLLKEPGAANAPQYFRLDPQHSVKESLAQKTVIEFPRVLVVLPEQFAAYALVPPQFAVLSEVLPKVTEGNEPSST